MSKTSKRNNKKQWIGKNQQNKHKYQMDWAEVGSGDRINLNE